jgi:hypothetical protein
MDEIGKQAVEASIRNMQPVLDDLHRELAGQSVDVVKPRLASEWAKAGGKITDPDLTQWATAISEGRHITLE